jgi:hypothetical protein
MLIVNGAVVSDRPEVEWGGFVGDDIKFLDV